MLAHSRMFCSHVQIAEGNTGGTICLETVSQQTEDREQPRNFEPSGRIMLTTLSDVDLEQFQAGAQYIISVERA